MKKLVLKLGASALTILPIVAVASCSSTPAEVPNIDNEVAKFDKSMVAKDSAKATTTKEAAKSIETASDKLLALGALIELPEMNSNFTYEVESVLVDQPNNTSITVSMKISEKAKPENTKVSKLVITDLKTSLTPLELEIKNFSISSPANEASKTLKTSEVITNINSAQNPAAKQAEVEKITTLPKPSAGFAIKILSATDGSTSTSVDVIIEISQEGKEETGKATFTITNLSALSAKEKLDEQANLLVTKEVLSDMKDQTPLEASKAIKSREILDKYYAPIKMSEGINYDLTSAIPNATVKTTLDLVLTVSTNVQGVEPVVKNVELTGFTSAQAKLAAQADLLINKDVLADKATETAKMASAAITNKETLLPYYANVPMIEGISYDWVSDEVVRDTVSVVLKVSSTEAGTVPVNKTVIISGFMSPQEKLTEQAERLVPKDVPTSKRTQSASQAKELIKSATILNDYYPTMELEGGITYNFVESKVNPDPNSTLNVKVTLRDEAGNTFDKIMKLTGFMSLQDKLAEQGEKLKSKASLITDVTASEAWKSIKTNEIFKKYYAPITFEEGVEYNFGSSKVNEADKTILDVILIISDIEGTLLNKNIQLTGFRALTALETEAAKLEISLPATDKAMTVNMAFRKITETATEAAKLEAIKSLVTGFPTLTEGYTFVIDSVTKVALALKSINISMTVSAPAPAGKTTRETKNAIFTISGLVAETNQQELTRLSNLLINKDVPEAQRVETATLTAPKINAETLATYYSTITLAKDVTYAWKSSVAKGDVVDVTVVITNTAANVKMDKTFTLSGFKTQQKELEDQAKLLVTKPVISDKDTDTAIMAAKAIKDNDTLLLYYANVAMSQGISYDFVSAIAEGTSVNVVVSVKSTIPNATTTPVQAVIVITGFMSSQDKLSEQAALLISKDVLAEKASELASVASEAITSTETLLPYYANVAMSEGISYEWVSDAAVGDDVEVVLKVSSTEPGTNSVTVTIKILGFRSKAQQDLIDKAELLVTKPVLAGKANETAISAAELMNAENMVEYYAKVELGQGFSYVFESVKVMGENSVELTVTVSSTAPHTQDITKAIIITGFTTPQKKLAEQALLFDDRATLVATGTAGQARLAISDNKTLETYYAPVKMSHGITYVFKNSTINRELNTTLNVIIDIIGQGGLKVQKTIQIKGFMTVETKLSQESEKFNKKTPSLVKTGTAQMALEAISDVETLATYYAKVTNLEPTIKYTFVSSSVNSPNNTILDVTLLLSDEQNTSKKIITIQLTEFRTPTAIETEAYKFAILKVANDQELHTTTAMRNINEATEQADKLIALKALVTGLPEIDTETYILTINSATLNPKDPSSINISITVSAKTPGEGDAAIKPATTRLIITGLTAETNEQELKRLATEKLIAKPAPADKRTQTAVEAAEAIKTTTILETYYSTVPIAKGITYEFKSASAAGNNVNVVVTLKNSADASLSVEHTLSITGFAEPASL